MDHHAFHRMRVQEHTNLTDEIIWVVLRWTCKLGSEKKNQFVAILLKLPGYSVWYEADFLRDCWLGDPGEVMPKRS